MSEGSTASAPYTRKNGVNPVDLFGVVRKLHKTEGNSSAQAPAARRSGASRRALIPPSMRALAPSTCPTVDEIQMLNRAGSLPHDNIPLVLLERSLCHYQ